MREPRDDVGEKCYTERRSDLEPLERGRCMSSLLPWAPLARTLGAEEAHIYIYIYKLRRLRGHKEKIDNTHRGKDEEDKHSHTQPNAYMPATHLLQQDLHTYIQTDKSDTQHSDQQTNPTYPTNIQPYNVHTYSATSTANILLRGALAFGYWWKIVRCDYYWRFC